MRRRVFIWPCYHQEATGPGGGSVTKVPPLPSPSPLFPSHPILKSPNPLPLLLEHGPTSRSLSFGSLDCGWTLEMSSQRWEMERRVLYLWITDFLYLCILSFCICVFPTSCFTNKRKNERNRNQWEAVATELSPLMAISSNTVDPVKAFCTVYDCVSLHSRLYTRTLDSGIQSKRFAQYMIVYDPLCIWYSTW